MNKKHLLTILTFGLFTNVYAQTMLGDGNVWTYCCKGFRGNVENAPLCELVYQKYTLKGECTIGDKIYKQVWSEWAKVLDVNKGIEKNENVVFFEPTYLLGVREEKGRIYVNKVEYQKTAVVDEEFGWNWFPTEGEEFVLYDFNEENGEIVIPYVGNIYALFYKAEVATDGIYRYNHLNLFYRDGKLEYKSPNFYPDPFFPEETVDGIEEQAYPIPLPQGKRAIFNLQGQRISVNSVFSAPSVLPKGVYIVDGKKVWVK